MKRSLYLISIWLYALSINAQTKEKAFADIVVKAFYSNAIKKYTEFYGGRASPPRAIRRSIEIFKNMSPDCVLGDNPFYLSLPTGSYVIVKFTDNYIVDQPDQDDIFITESGCAGDKAAIYISTDGESFEKLGVVVDCKTSSLDLADIGFKGEVNYVRVEGLDNMGATPGFDLVNIYGIASASVDRYDEPDDLHTYLSDSSSVQKSFILEHVNFEFNSSELKSSSYRSLNKLVSALLDYESIKLQIMGHTDSIGSSDYNSALSLERANSVKNYLVTGGVDSQRLTTNGKGEKEPLKSNYLKGGRAANRRVEFQRIN
ncbi:MAG: OmpA family protein [Cyclobacteriaceae bacterium]